MAWALLSLLGCSMMLVVAPRRNSDIYEMQRGMRTLGEQPLLVIGGYVVFAWAGVALVSLVLAFYEALPADSRAFPARAATAFGRMAGMFFLLFGLVGGFAMFDLTYLQSVRSEAYVQDAYLPLMLNRTLAAAITVSGLWFALMNWVALHTRRLPPFVSFVGLSAGLVALFGFVLPGGGFSPLSLGLSGLWGFAAGVHLWRR